MMRTLEYLALLFVLCGSLNARASLDQEDLEAVGRFLVLDFASLPTDKGREPLTSCFWVKETGLTHEITEEEAQRPECVAAALSAGVYREITVINEVSGLGALVRTAYINDDHRVVWGSDDQSLLRFAHKPALGNTGVLRITELNPTKGIGEYFEGFQRGRMPAEWRPTEDEITTFTASIGVIWRVVVSRPAAES